MDLSIKLFCEAGSFSCCLNPHRSFSVTVVGALFSHTGNLGCTVCLAPQLFLLVYPHTNVGLSAPPSTALPAQVLQPSPCCESTASWLPISTPPTSLDECFFLYSLVIGLPYSLIFWQFWLFFIFKYVVILLLVVQGSKVYLHMTPSFA